jgi:hypothetical protein
LGQLDVLLELRLSLRHKATLVASSNVRPHGDLPSVVAPGNDCGAIPRPNFCELRQGNTSSFTRRDQDVPYRVGVAASLWDKSHGYIEAAFALKQRTDGPAPDGQLDHVLNVTYVDSVARHVLPVDADRELRLIGLLFDRRVNGAMDLL